MKVRALNSDHDWTFGSGTNNYVANNAAIAQNINTRLASFVGNCFFDLRAGIDWFNLLGSKNQVPLNLAISSLILNTSYVSGIIQLSLGLNSQRQFSVTYKVQTTFSTSASTFVLNQSVG